MRDVQQIIIAIENFLIKERKHSTDPVEAGAYLGRIGLLKDSKDRPGKPLRDVLRKGLIKHAYQNGNRWVIPRLGKANLKPISVPKPAERKPNVEKVPSSFSSEHNKLNSIAKLIAEKLETKYGETASYEFEFKPSWLSTVPSQSVLKEKWHIVDEIYSSLIDRKYSLDERMELARKGQQSFDIWFTKPVQFAVEFDESQHFNQFRAKSLESYSGIDVGFSVDFYLSLNQKQVGPGKSGFKKLKSNDPLFPELLSGEAQDNRIRQRAFRDTLKDILPIVLGHKPTIRIPYQIANKSIKDFSEQELVAINDYLDTLSFFK